MAAAGAGPIAVDDRCNLGCTFCGIARRGPRDIGSIEADLRAVVAAGRRPLFGGGEPTMDARLPALIERARALGADERQIETNALRCADERYVERLVAAGLTHARVMLPAADDATAEAVTQVAGRLDLAWRGARNLLEAGVTVGVVVPVARANIGGLAALVRRVAAELPGVASLVLRPVFFGRRGETAPDVAVLARARADTVPTDELAGALAGALELAATHGLEARLDLAGGLPLCAFRRTPEALARLSGSPAGHPRPPECAGCALGERCGGQGAVDRGVHGAYQVQPYATVPRRTRGLQGDEPVLLFSSGPPSSLRPRPQQPRADAPGGKAEIRVTMPCNQRCTFCFVNRDAPDADLPALERAVDQAVAAGVEAIVFTGGEPTLSPHLPQLLARARAAGVPLIGMQSNALRLADGPLAATLVDAGLQHAHISLHAVDPARYLETTGLGTPEQAMRGAEALAARGVEVTWSLVLHRTNADHLGATLAFLHSRLPGTLVVLSLAREQENVDRPWSRILLGYGEAGRAFAEALDTAEALGQPLLSAGTCALPPCALPRVSLLRHGPKVAVPPRTATWRRVRAGDTFAEDGVHGRSWLSRCEGCALRPACPGLDARTLERFGDGDIAPIASDEPGIAPLLAALAERDEAPSP